ncbi:hypothetical protein SPWS13_3775 [Shewanella putrefaciens]|nr:hypothetical protein SPWS13_3775 [Shewanella putrefaciens]
MGFTESWRCAISWQSAQQITKNLIDLYHRYKRLIHLPPIIDMSHRDKNKLGKRMMAFLFYFYS